MKNLRMLLEETNKENWDKNDPIINDKIRHRI